LPYSLLVPRPRFCNNELLNLKKNDDMLPERWLWPRYIVISCVRLCGIQFGTSPLIHRWKGNTKI
jgi:hypothetical protein